LWVFSAHYRKQIEFDEEMLNQFKELHKRLITAVEILKKITRSSGASHRLEEQEMNILRTLESIELQFHEAMTSDFNTPKALEAINRLLSTIYKDIEPRENVALALRAYSLLYNFNKILGVLDKYFGEKVQVDIDLIEKLVDVVIMIRTELRKRRDYELSDKIREELLKLGIRVFDYKDGSKWVLER
ncbi:MAG: DALR domain-containing protein, partial [Ignisphaera sp.]